MEPSEAEKETSSMLKHDQFCEQCYHRPSKQNRLSVFLYKYCLPALFSVVVVLLVIVVPGMMRLADRQLESSACKTTTDKLGFLPSSDAIDFVDYQPEKEDYWKTSPYSGYPSEEQGRTWAELQQVRGLRLSRAEGRMINLADGLRVGDDSHATILGVMHNLHCLRMMKQYLYAEYYYPELSPVESAKMRNHSDHCIETLRESLTCLPDLTPHALHWRDEDERAHLDLNPVVKRQCVDWASLVRWQRNREYHLDDLWTANPPKTQIRDRSPGV